MCHSLLYCPAANFCNSWNNGHMQGLWNQKDMDFNPDSITLSLYDLRQIILVLVP